MDQEACRRVPKIEGLNGLRANSGQFAGVQPVGLPATSWRALDSGPHSQELGKILVTSISSIPKVVLSPRLASRSSIVSPLPLLQALHDWGAQVEGAASLAAASPHPNCHVVVRSAVKRVLKSSSDVAGAGNIFSGVS